MESSVTDGSNVVFLKFSSPHMEDDTLAFVACKVCRNKAFSFKRDRVNDYPLVCCTACGQHMGRMGWANDDA
jgi:hypothetical protein